MDYIDYVHSVHRMQLSYNHNNGRIIIHTGYKIYDSHDTLPDIIHNIQPTITSLSISGVNNFIKHDISMLCNIKSITLHNIDASINYGWQLYLPKCLTYLSISQCIFIKSLDDLPESLTSLYAEYKRNTHYDNLPIRLLHMGLQSINRHTYIANMDYMPPCLNTLNYDIIKFDDFDNPNYYIYNKYVANSVKNESDYDEYICTHYEVTK